MASLIVRDGDNPVVQHLMARLFRDPFKLLQIAAAAITQPQARVKAGESITPARPPGRVNGPTTRAAASRTIGPQHAESVETPEHPLLW